MKLFEEVAISGLRLKNRFVRSATWEGMAGPGGEVTDGLVSIYEELARGEVGLILTGYAYVDKMGKAMPGMLGVDSDGHLPGLRRLVEACHAHGAKIALQIAHGGSQSKFDTGLGTEGASAVLEPATNNTPVAMTLADIERVRKNFVSAAIRGKNAGFDAIELHAAHGYLLSQFLSPYSNQRDDEYGGPIENRSRLLLEVYDAVRSAVGPDFPVMAKVNSSDFTSYGLTDEDSLWVCERLSERGIDAIELSGGIPAAGAMAAARMAINSPEKEAYFREYARALRPSIKCPLILVGGLRSLEVMEKSVEEKTADLFSMARPLISEPCLIKRWKDGDRRPARCISCNRCIGAAFKEGRLYCVNFAEEDAKAARA
jgi:2,4-dienoyl-CoA reductase-like NADH-dependent reductase (Old Yellow Enzyme family)